MMQRISAKDLAQSINLTLLRPDATTQDIEQLCAEARLHHFRAVLVPGCRVVLACHHLEESGIKVGTVIGFPLGNTDSDVKRYETEVAVDNGAGEIDLVINRGWLKEGKDDAVRRELRDVVEAADDRIVNVILETSGLTKEEIIRGSHLAVDAGARGVKTGADWGSPPVREDDVRLIREVVGEKRGIKAAGGIQDLALALLLLKAGADCLDSPHGMKILDELTKMYV